VAKSRHLRVICTLHDYAIACPRGTFYNLRRLDNCNLRPLTPRCLASDCHISRRAKLPLIAQRLAQAFPGQMCRAIHTYVAVSSASADRLRPYLPKKRPLTVIENPVQLAERPAPRTHAKDNELFLVIGRMTVEKGTRLADQAGNKANLPMIFGGEGPAETEVAAHCAAAHVTGWVAPDQVVGWLRRARALVFPSLRPETQGLVVSEAAALGIPALVGTRTAAASFVRHGETGLHFDHADVGPSSPR
jgi:glycosyltransferase involved in cell wall biosynthesis